jgi:hypothetical protein
MFLALAAGFFPMALTPLADGAAPKESATPFVTALWLVQRYGTVEAVNPRNDIRIKASLAKALGREAVLAPEGIKGIMRAETFNKLAGGDCKLDVDEMRQALADFPESRKRLYPKIDSHLDYLATSFDLIDEPHRQAGESLARWITEHYQPGTPRCFDRVHGELQAKHPRRDDGKRRRCVLRNAGGPVQQRRDGSDRV